MPPAGLPALPSTSSAKGQISPVRKAVANCPLVAHSFRTGTDRVDSSRVAAHPANDQSSHSDRRGAVVATWRAEGKGSNRRRTLQPDRSPIGVPGGVTGDWEGDGEADKEERHPYDCQRDEKARPDRHRAQIQRHSGKAGGDRFEGADRPVDQHRQGESAASEGERGRDKAEKDEQRQEFEAA